ncbi:hypothetical protein FACS1894178_1590 [Bacteroidia bacterium]|nr:hypothetical protein FACS1894178_1590 [Bacteroidia bacterium]
MKSINKTKYFLTATDRNKNQKEILSFLSDNGLSKIKGGNYSRTTLELPQPYERLPYAESTYVRSY